MSQLVAPVSCAVLAEDQASPMPRLWAGSPSKWMSVTSEITLFGLRFFPLQRSSNQDSLRWGFTLSMCFLLRVLQVWGLFWNHTQTHTRRSYLVSHCVSCLMASRVCTSFSIPEELPSEDGWITRATGVSAWRGQRSSSGKRETQTSTRTTLTPQGRPRIRQELLSGQHKAAVSQVTKLHPSPPTHSGKHKHTHTHTHTPSSSMPLGHMVDQHNGFVILPVKWLPHWPFRKMFVFPWLVFPLPQCWSAFVCTAGLHELVQFNLSLPLSRGWVCSYLIYLFICLFILFYSFIPSSWGVKTDEVGGCLDGSCANAWEVLTVGFTRLRISPHPKNLTLTLTLTLTHEQNLTNIYL